MDLPHTREFTYVKLIDYLGQLAVAAKSCGEPIQIITRANSVQHIERVLQDWETYFENCREKISRR
jgi:hypothetical protein